MISFAIALVVTALFFYGAGKIGFIDFLKQFI